MERSLGSVIAHSWLGTLADLGLVGMDYDPDLPMFIIGCRLVRGRRLTDAEKTAVPCSTTPRGRGQREERRAGAGGAAGAAATIEAGADRFGRR